MITTLELQQLERALDAAGVARGPTRRGVYETHGDPRHGLWLLVLSQTTRMPITGEVLSRAGTVVFRHADHDVVLEALPPSLTGGGWRAWLELERWFPEPDQPDTTVQDHEARTVPALRALGLRSDGDEVDDEALRSDWSSPELGPAGLARIVAGLLAAPWIWLVPELPEPEAQR